MPKLCNALLVQIRHTDNKCGPFSLLSLINACGKESSSTANTSEKESISSSELISGVSEEIGSQLHDGIMKAAHRYVLDEIIGNVIADYVAMKKAQKQLKNEHGREDLIFERVCY